MKKFKKIMAMCLTMVILLQGICAFAYGNISTNDLRQKHHDFAVQYEYKEGDSDKSFLLYPGINYTSGIEYDKDGSEYECPAIYIDDHAMYFNSYSLRKGETKFIINNVKSEFFEQGVAYNNRLLVPADAFKEVGCAVETDEEAYVTTISKDGVVLEILPNLIGMRKNRDNGFYVPLEVCARIVDGTLYVPVRAVADEFGLYINWDAATNTVEMANLLDK